MNKQTDFNAMNYWHRIDEFAILIGFVSSGLARQSSAPFFSLGLEIGRTCLFQGMGL